MPPLANRNRTERLSLSARQAKQRKGFMVSERSQCTNAQRVLGSPAATKTTLMGQPLAKSARCLGRLLEAVCVVTLLPRTPGSPQPCKAGAIPSALSQSAPPASNIPMTSWLSLAYQCDRACAQHFFPVQGLPSCGWRLSLRGSVRRAGVSVAASGLAAAPEASRQRGLLWGGPRSPRREPAVESGPAEAGPEGPKQEGAILRPAKVTHSLFFFLGKKFSSSAAPWMRRGEVRAAGLAALRWQRGHDPWEGLLGQRSGVDRRSDLAGACRWSWKERPRRGGNYLVLFLPSDFR